MQAPAAGYSGYAGASCCCFLEKGFKTNCLTNTFEKGCTSDASRLMYSYLARNERVAPN
jgi:hypothetical protein